MPNRWPKILRLKHSSTDLRAPRGEAGNSVAPAGLTFWADASYGSPIAAAIGPAIGPAIQRPRAKTIETNSKVPSPLRGSVAVPAGTPKPSGGAPRKAFRVPTRCASLHPLSSPAPWTGLSRKFTRVRARQSRTNPLSETARRIGAGLRPSLCCFGSKPGWSGFT